MKVWFITGTSKGFGRIWAQAALARGDKVAAATRHPEALSGLRDKYGDNVLPLALDVRDRSAAFTAVQQAFDKFGRLDVVVNNAGYGHFGAIEELSEREAREQMEVNLFGALWVTQAALPLLRKQRSGHILQVSSIAGVNAFPYLGMYNAGKWALEGLSQALSQEVKDMGIHVTLIEPTGFATDWAGPSAIFSAEMPAYDQVRRISSERRKLAGKPGDPEATAPVVLKLVDMEEPPLRIFFGATANQRIHAEYQKRLDEWDRHNLLSIEAHGE